MDMNASEVSAADLYREEVQRARVRPAAEKLLDGPRLFDLTRRIMADGLRDRFPGADENEVQRILAEQLARLRRLERCP